MSRKPKPFNNPFLEVGKELKKKAKKAKQAERKASAAAKARPTRPTPPERAGPEDDADLFAQAMAGTQRMEDPRGAVQKPLPPANADGIPVYDEDAEAYAELVSIVEGRARFDISDSDEFIEGGLEGLDRRVLQKLRKGDFAFRDYLDLHGMTKGQAREEVEAFIAETHTEGRRCVLIVHGRGNNSKDNIPVLKVALKSWLQRGRIARRVLAFCTAQPTDGGAGAMYVLLRR